MIRQLVTIDWKKLLTYFIMAQERHRKIYSKVLGFTNPLTPLPTKPDQIKNLETRADRILKDYNNAMEKLYKKQQLQQPSTSKISTTTS